MYASYTNEELTREVEVTIGLQFGPIIAIKADLLGEILQRHELCDVDELDALRSEIQELEGDNEELRDELEKLKASRVGDGTRKD